MSASNLKSLERRLAKIEAKRKANKFNVYLFSVKQGHESIIFNEEYNQFDGMEVCLDNLDKVYTLEEFGYDVVPRYGGAKVIGIPIFMSHEEIEEYLEREIKTVDLKVEDFDCVLPLQGTIPHHWRSNWNDLLLSILKVDAKIAGRRTAKTTFGAEIFVAKSFMDRGLYIVLGKSIKAMEEILNATSKDIIHPFFYYNPMGVKTPMKERDATLMEIMINRGLSSKLDKKDNYIPMKNGSRITLSAVETKDPLSISGRTFKGVMITEAALHRNGLLGSFNRFSSSILKSKRGVLLLETTANPSQDFKEVLDMIRHNVWARITVMPYTKDNLGIFYDAVFIEKMKELYRNVPEIFEREFMCKIGDTLQTSVLGPYLNTTTQLIDTDTMWTPEIKQTKNLYISFDFGNKDYTALWFFVQYRPGEWIFVNFFESKQKSILYFFDYIRKFLVKYNIQDPPHIRNRANYNVNAIPNNVWLVIPHDSKQTKAITGTGEYNKVGINYAQQCRANGFKQFYILPSNRGGIGFVTARRVLPTLYFDQARCWDGIQNLLRNHYETNFHDERIGAGEGKINSGSGGIYRHALDSFAYASMFMECDLFKLGSSIKLQPYDVFSNILETEFTGEV